MTCRILLAAILIGGAAPAARAQGADYRSDREEGREARVRGWDPLAIAKWGTLAAAIGSAAYGLSQSLAADDRYDRIDGICADRAERCSARRADGDFLDAELDRLAREADHFDQRARTGLIAAQIGLAASVALFILDLRDSAGPPNVPYSPSGFRVRQAFDGGIRIEFSRPLP